MGLKKYRPITPTLRHSVLPNYDEITRSRPVKSLTERVTRTGGRAEVSRSRSSGSGNTTVVFYSTPISVRVCR